MTRASRNTTTGLKFENDPRTFHTKLHKNEIDVTKYKLYTFLFKQTGVKWENFLSKRILVDEAYIDMINKTYTGYEKKTQNGTGSADEKLQTCAYKITQLRKVCKKLGIPPENVKYIYTLDKWFGDKQYKDTLDYIKEIPGCDYEILGDGESAT